MSAGTLKIGKDKFVVIREDEYRQMKADLGREVEASVENEESIITPSRLARQGWDEAFKRMAEQGDDAMLDPETSNHFDEDEWEWQ